MGFGLRAGATPRAVGDGEIIPDVHPGKGQFAVSSPLAHGTQGGAEDALMPRAAQWSPWPWWDPRCCAGVPMAVLVSTMLSMLVSVQPRWCPHGHAGVPMAILVSPQLYWYPHGHGGVPIAVLVFLWLYWWPHSCAVFLWPWWCPHSWCPHGHAGVLIAIPVSPWQCCCPHGHTPVPIAILVSP